MADEKKPVTFTPEAVRRIIAFVKAVEATAPANSNARRMYPR